MNEKSKLWGGRFSKSVDPRAEGFTSSLSFDRRLWREDLEGSRAHVRMLGRQGILSPDEVAQILDGLEQVEKELETGTFPFRQEFEDIHLNIEKRLSELIGPVGGKLHTARSRNDQVALDEHLYLRQVIEKTAAGITALQEVILGLAQEHLGVIFPGYTHLQRAQPVLFSHHLLAYFFMLQRDYERLRDAWKRADLMPLGAGALAGTSFPIDRHQVAQELGFTRLYENSIDAVSDRDYFLEYLFCAAVLMVHLSRLAEEIVLWSTTEFGFIELDDAFATGSSIMPQKKNPDVAELVRGKTGRVFGNLIALLTVLKGLPLAYNSDLQEDKERVFDTADTVLAVLPVMAGLLSTMKVKKDRLAQAVRQDYSNATEVADYLAKKGVPFREAHAITGRAVRYALEKGKYLLDLTLEEWQSFSPQFAPDLFAFLAPAAVVAAKTSFGGTAPERVREQLERAAALLAERREKTGMTENQ